MHQPVLAVDAQHSGQRPSFADGDGVQRAWSQVLPPGALVSQRLERGIGHTPAGQIVPVSGQVAKGALAVDNVSFHGPPRGIVGHG